MNDQITDAKLFEFFSGGLSPTEEETIREWAWSGEENRMHFIKCQNKYLALQFGTQATQVRLDYSSIKDRIRPKKNSLRKKIISRISVSAAVLVIGFVMVIFFRYGSNTPDNFKGNTEHGTSKALLELSDGTFIELGPDKSDVIEQNGSHISINRGEISYVNEADTDNVIYNSITIPRGGEYKLTLNDGTVIWLNSESSLRYPQSFGGGERRVFLKGEAYFNVSYVSDMPFIVETDDQIITVLGTEFNIYAYPMEARSLSTLVSGSVRINVRHTEEEFTLVPGQQAILERESVKIEIVDVDAAEVSAWKEGYFSIEKMALGEVIHKLSRWYDVDFKFVDDAAKILTYKGSLARHTDLIKVLNLIQTISPVEFKYQKDVIEVGMKK